MKSIVDLSTSHDMPVKQIVACFYLDRILKMGYIGVKNIRILIVILVIFLICGCEKNDGNASKDGGIPLHFDGEEDECPFVVVMQSEDLYTREYFSLYPQYGQGIPEDYILSARVEVKKPGRKESGSERPVSKTRIIRMADGHTVYDGDATLSEDFFISKQGDLFLGKLFYDYDYFHHLVSTCEIDSFDSFGSGMNKWYSKVKFTDEDCCDTDRCIFSVSKSNSQDISVKRNEFLKKQGFEGREAVAEYTTETGDARTELYYDSDNNTGCFLVTKICNKDGEKKEVELYGAAIDEIVIGETPDISMLDYSSEDKEGWDYLNEFGITKVTEEKDGRIVGISYNPAEYADMMVGSSDRYIYRENGSLCWHVHKHNWDWGTMNTSMEAEHDGDGRIRQYYYQNGDYREGFETWFYTGNKGELSYILDDTRAYGASTPSGELEWKTILYVI